MISNIMRMMPVGRFFLSSFTLLLALSTYFADYGITMPHSVRASVFATATAFMLFIALLPANRRDLNNVPANVLIRGGGPILGILAGTHWFLAEADPESKSTFLFLLIVFGGLVASQVIATLVLAMQGREPRQARPSREKLEELLKGEQQKLSEVYASQGAPSLLEQVQGLEVIVANLFLTLRENPSMGLTDQDIRHLLQYSEDSNRASPFRRIYLWFQLGWAEWRK